MTDEECIHGLTAATCALCKHGPSKPSGPPQIEVTFKAKFEGECPDCRTPIHVGDIVHRYSNERYYHEGCSP